MTKPPHKTEEFADTGADLPEEFHNIANTLTAGGTNNQLSEAASARPVLLTSSAALHYHSGNQDHYYPLSRLSGCTIGRSDDNDICLADRLVSRHHALIRCAASGNCELADLGSSYGTRVNGKAIEGTIPLKDGDTIIVGQHAIDFIEPRLRTDLLKLSGNADVVAVRPPHSLISVLTLNLRGYVSLSQILGDADLRRAMDNIGAIADGVFTRHHVWKKNRPGRVIKAIWAHPEGRLTHARLQSIHDAIDEIHIAMRPLQKRYRLLRPIEFEGSLTIGELPAEYYGEESFEVLCDVLESAYNIDLSIYNAVSDLRLSKDARLNLLDEAASTANQAIDPFQAFEDATRAEAVALLGGDAVLGRTIRTDQELLEALIQGFPSDVLRALREAGLPHAMFEQVVAPRRTLMRRKAEGQRLTRSESDAVWRLAIAFALGARVLNGRKAAVDWLSRPKSTFANQTPVDLLETSVGAAHVYQMLRRLEWGDVA